MWKFNTNNIGEFVEKDYGKTFTYREVESDYNPYDMPHVIDVLDGTRYAQVLKTVAYVVVDEDAEGNAVIERWEIKQHRVYNAV